jgi:ABC-type antimicrobial peptide transport system permease subunit
MSLVIRTSGDPLTLAPAVRKAVQSIDRNQPLFNLESLDQRLSSSLAERRRRAYLLGAFAFIALLIALIGVYGVMAYSVARRTREIGVRLALGAEKSAVLRMILGQALRMALTGVILGAIAAVALTRVLSSFLYGSGAARGEGGPDCGVKARVGAISITLVEHTLRLRAALSRAFRIWLNCRGAGRRAQRRPRACPPKSHYVFPAPLPILLRIRS